MTVLDCFLDSVAGILFSKAIEAAHENAQRH
jgi:hypothetical protein